MTSRPRLRALKPLLVVADLRRSLDFYVGKLGFRDPGVWGDPPCFAMLHRDGLDLMLSQAEEPAHVQPHGSFGVWDLSLVVGDVAAEQAALEAAGATLAKGPTDTFYAMREIEVLDPDGHRICIAQDVSGEAFVNADTFSGVLDVGAARLRLVLKISRAGDALVARLDSPDQNAFGLPIDEVVLERGTLRFTMAALGASYEGTHDEPAAKFVGRWSQRGRSWPLVLERDGAPRRE